MDKTNLAPTAQKTRNKQPKLTDMFKSSNSNSGKSNPNPRQSNLTPGHNQTRENFDVLSPDSLILSTGSTSNPYEFQMAPLDLSPVGSLNPTMTIKSLEGFKFPKTGNRSFQLHWLIKYKWLEYAIDRDGAFCFPCRQFEMNTTKETAFTTIGFKDWKHATGKKVGFSRHETSISHNSAMCSWQEMLNRERDNTTVVKLLTHDVLEKRRYYMKSIIEVIIFLVANEIAFRGNWDKERHKEDGIFRNLFEFKLKDNEYLQKCQKIMPRNATYMSPEIQNELIAIIVKMVQKQIVSEANTADVDYFTLLADGTKDRNNKEIVSVVLRYVKDALARETLLCFQTIDNFDTKTQADLLLKTLSSYGLNTQKLLSQCYDGAYVMSGDDGGIQRIVQQKLGRIIPYVHCFNHRLHLVVIAAVECNDIVRLFFDHLKMVYSFFHRAKVQSLYSGSAVCKLITTRWAGHHRSTQTVHKNYDEIIKTLELVIADTKKFDGDDIATATGILSTIRKREFVFMLKFMDKFLSLISPADKILQSVDVGFREALPVIESVQTEILKLRSNESFTEIWNASEELMKKTANTASVIEERPHRNIKRPSSLANFLITDRIGERNLDGNIEIRSAHYFVIDKFLEEIKRRFKDNSAVLVAISRVDEFNIKVLKPLEEIGLILPPQEEMTVAKNFIDTRKRIYDEEMSKKDIKERTLFKNRFTILKELFPMREALPQVYEFMATLDTFASSTSTCESSFSALERLGSPKRISMDNERLRNLSFLAYESKRLEKISIEEVLMEFDRNPKRRIQLY